MAPNIVNKLHNGATWRSVGGGDQVQ